MARYQYSALCHVLLKKGLWQMSIGCRLMREAVLCRGQLLLLLLLQSWQKDEYYYLLGKDDILFISLVVHMRVVPFLNKPSKKLVVRMRFISSLAILKQYQDNKYFTIFLHFLQPLLDYHLQISVLAVTNIFRI